jgi:alpha-tubulin suppressor-like RCC1 family protein
VAIVAALALAPPASARTATTVRAAAITAGVDHTCALTSAGDVKCWGYNGHDELGTGRGDDQNSSTPVNVSGLRSGVTAISAGVRHTCALLRTGRVKCWGANYSGALGDGTTDRHFAPIDVVALSGVVAISAGYDHSCALTGAGGVKCWGSNTFGVLGDGTTDDRWTPTDVSGLSSGVTVVATGNLITCAVTSAGGVKCWSGDYGWTPVGVPGLDSGVTAIAANVGHACALTSRGSVKCWGENDHGQLGDGTKAMRPTPVAVSGLSTGVTAIGAGAFHTCAVTRNGGAKCWGVNGVGELGDGTTHTRLTPVGVVGFGPRAKLAIVSRMVTVTPARIAPLKLRCEAARCRGILTLVKLGSRRFSIAAGHTRAVKVKLTTRGFQLLVRKGRLSTRARASYEQPAGDPTVATRRITLEAPK